MRVEKGRTGVVDEESDQPSVTMTNGTKAVPGYDVCLFICKIHRQLVGQVAQLAQPTPFFPLSCNLGQVDSFLEH